MPILLGAAIQAETVGLLWQPKKGDQLSYVYNVVIGQGEAATSLEAPISMTVTQVDADGYTVRSVVNDALVTVLGEQMRDKREQVVVTRFGPRGNLLKIVEGLKDPKSFENARVTKFIAPPMPLKVGESWSHNFPKDDAGETAVIYKFKEIKQDQGRNLAVVDFTLNRKGEEEPYGTGSWQVDVQTGVPEKLDAKTNADNGTVFKLRRVRG